MLVSSFIETMCDYLYCKTNTNTNTNTEKNCKCIWCNRIFHRQCLLTNKCNTDLYFEVSTNIQCNYCNPAIPFTLQNEQLSDEFEIRSYGTYVDQDLEDSKAEYEKQYLYPVGFVSSRSFPSYKIIGTKTTITCEIFCANNDFTNDDEYIFKITFIDDPDNPVYATKSLRLISSELKKRLPHKQIPSGIKIFGLDREYIQYLISIHVPGAQDIISNQKDYTELFTILYETKQVDRYVTYDIKNNNPNTLITKYLFNVHSQDRSNFDPQKQLFIF